MKQIAILMLVLGWTLCCHAQIEDPIYTSKEKPTVTVSVTTPAPATPADPHLILVDVPKNLNIKDKIFLVNRTSYCIAQAAVVLISDGAPKTIGNAMTVYPGQTYEMASFSGNWLKKLKGQTIGIKIKGSKDPAAISGSDDTDAFTYDFTITLSESNHDLYITVTNDDDTLNF